MFFLLLFVVLAWMVVLVTKGVYASPGEGMSDDALILGALGFVVIGVGTFAWLALAVRCRSCSAKVAWHLMRRAEHGRWWLELNRMECCPACGARGELRRS